MNWLKLVVSVVAIFAGLAFYLIICHTKWGKKHADMQYFIMLTALLVAVAAGGLAKHLLGMM